MPNAFAFLVLAIWPIVTMFIFARMRVEPALIWSLLLGYLFLPEYPTVFDLPLMPAFDKHNIPALAAFVAILYRYGLRGSLLPENTAAKILVAIFVLSPAFTAALNPNPIAYGIVFMPGMGIKNALALAVEKFLLILPFLLARQFLASGGAQLQLMRALIVAALIYSIPMLIEIRLSPQMHIWFYGYHQHDFSQTMRFGGWRPTVFLYHGIWVAFFTMTALVCAIAMWKIDHSHRRTRYLAAGLYLLVLLVLAKSLGAIIFAAILLPLLLFAAPRTQLRVAVILAVLATSYPVLKNAGFIPEERMMDWAAQIDEERAESLLVRFSNETRLLERALERPLFGWGAYGRNQFFDPASGMLETVTDGRWIILIGVYGWVGFLAEFGLLLLPLLLLWRASSDRKAGMVAITVPPLALLLGINIVDLLPNATLTPLTWIVSGALLGQAERMASRQREGQTRAPRTEWRSVM